MIIAISQLFGLPAHPLFVHVPIVLIPLALVTSVLATFKRFRREFLFATAVMAVLGATFLSLGAQAGEALEHDLPRSEAIHEHAEMGERSQAPTVTFAALAVGAVLASEVMRRNLVFKGRSLPKAVAPLLLVLTLAGGVFSTIVVSQAGHSGAKSVWTSQPTKKKP